MLSFFDFICRNLRKRRKKKHWDIENLRRQCNFHLFNQKISLWSYTIPAPLSIDFPVDANTVNLIQFIFWSESQKKRIKEQERERGRERGGKTTYSNAEDGCHWISSNIMCIWWQPLLLIWYRLPFKHIISPNVKCRNDTELTQMVV